MSTWHYQLIKHIYPKGDVMYGVHEYYPATQDNNEFWTLMPVDVAGEDKEDVIWVIKTMLKDIEKHGVKEVKHEE